MSLLRKILKCDDSYESFEAMVSCGVALHKNDQKLVSLMIDKF